MIYTKKICLFYWYIIRNNFNCFFGYLEKCSNDAVGAYNNFGWLVDILNY